LRLPLPLIPLFLTVPVKNRSQQGTYRAPLLAVFNVVFAVQWPQIRWQLGGRVPEKMYGRSV